MSDDAWGCPGCGWVYRHAPGCARAQWSERSRIPPEALAAVERVLAHRAAAVAEVPGQERWRKTTIDHQTAKALSHAAEAALGTTEDRDTGEHPLAHAAARALLGLALYEMGRVK